MNQTSKVWNFAANLYIDFSHSLVFNDTANLSGFNSANIDHIGIIVCAFFLNIVCVKTVRDIYDTRTISWPNIVKNTKQLEIRDILSKMYYI